MVLDQSLLIVYCFNPNYAIKESLPKLEILHNTTGGPIVHAH